MRPSSLTRDLVAWFGKGLPLLLALPVVVAGWAGATTPDAASPNLEAAPTTSVSTSADPPPPLAAPASVEPVGPDTTGTPSQPAREPLRPLETPPLGQHKRLIPSYDGRPSPPPSAREVLVWVPRAVLFPAFVVAEYGLRRPGVAFARWAEAHYVWTRVIDFFTWNDRKSGVYPVLSIDLGINQTVGVTLFSNELLVPANSLRLSASVGMQSAFSVGGQDRLKILRDGTGALFASGHFTARPDGVFYGTGSATRTGDKSYFGFVTEGGSLGFTGELGGLSRATVELGYRAATFSGSHISASTPSIDARYGGSDQPPLPGGFEGYRLIEPHVALVLDSRDPRLDIVARGTGVRVQTDTAFAIDPSDARREFLTWGIAAAGFYDFSGARHVLALEVAARFAENLGTRETPFTELPALGGGEWMRGFLAGRLRGPSTLAVTLQYRYPFWTFLDGELFSGLGNAFAPHFRDLRADRFFLNYGLGLRTTFSRDSSIVLTFAFATNRLDAAPFHPADALRFSVGVIHGF